MKLITVKRYAARINADAFGNSLELPCFQFTRNRRIHGEYKGNIIAINPNNTSADIIETIYHELLHDFIDTVLDSPDNNDHGFIFWAWYYRLLPDYIEAHYYD